MDSSFKVLADWTEARKIVVPGSQGVNRAVSKQVNKWRPREVGTFKINVDASVFPGAQTFSIGMVMRNHVGTFLAGRNQCFSGKILRDVVTIESDSHLAVKAIAGDSLNFLETSEVVECCKLHLESLQSCSVVFIRKVANKVAHEVARIPCLVNSHNLFTSPPTWLLEALSSDLLF
ncbi:uncharacterized protein LOC141696278 [Apium graveolens]|uniref:uncharacterized protein LOC141696278 n=1 Tax=Apium graveolens TaxID=4045 RepID=UPI003D7A5233